MRSTAARRSDKVVLLPLLVAWAVCVRACMGVVSASNAYTFGCAAAHALRRLLAAIEPHQGEQPRLHSLMLRCRGGPRWGFDLKSICHMQC